MASSDTSFAWRLKKAITAKNISQKDLCSRIGISAPTLSQYLQGNRAPSVSVIVQLCQALEVSSDYLLGLSPAVSPITVGENDFQFRDSTIRFFLHLNDTNNDDRPCEDISNNKHAGSAFPASYKSYIKNEDWTYVRHLTPITDEQSFFFDLLEDDRIFDIENDIHYYQQAISYMRLFKDRYDAFKNELSDEEKQYASCFWDSPSSRIDRQKSMSDNNPRKNDLFWLFEEPECYHIDGIPPVYADKATIHKYNIKKKLCEIVDTCCENFERSHEQFFKQEKEHFISYIKNQTLIKSNDVGIEHVMSKK